MNSDLILTVADNSVKLARKYAAENNFGRAFSHYLVIFKLKPDWKSLLKDEFSVTLCKWGIVLEEKNKVSNLFECYKEAIEIFPKNEVILNNLGAHLLRCHFLKEAAYYFQQCLLIKPNFIRARYNLESVLNLAVERWHFRMLNDRHRNEAFRVAIIKKIKQGFDTVLDIGTGTGLLSLFCLEGNASEVYACDSSTTMVEMAEKVLRSNNASNVKIINKHSSELLLPKDIPSRVSLIVTETLDSGLLGEGILYTLSHAWSNLLLPPTCPLNRQINQSGKFAFVIPFGAKIYVTGIECDSISKRSHLNQTENFFNFDGSYVVHDCGNYDTQDLNLVGHKYLTNTEELLVVNFNDPNFIEEMLSGKLDKELKLSCKESGRLDCFAVWFDLLVDENIVLNTGPESTTNHAWEQAIFLLPKSQLVTKNQDLVIEALFLNSHLRVKCRSLWEESLELSKDVITVLNNTKLVQALLQTKNKLLNAFNHSVNIIDWFPFPIFGLNFIMSRSKDFKDKLICFVSSEKDQQIVNLIAHKYGLEDQVTVEIENNVEDYLLKKEKYDLVILNFVECTGEIKENCVSQLGRIRALLNPSGIILPEEVIVMGQLVHSDWLLKVSKVLGDQVTCGYRIGEFINLYQIRHFIDIDLGIDKILLSNPVELFRINFDETFAEIVIPCSNSVAVNAIIYWFKIRFMKDCDDVVTNDETSTINQSAFLFDGIKGVEELKCIVIYSNGLFNVELLPNNEPKKT